MLLSYGQCPPYNESIGDGTAYPIGMTLEEFLYFKYVINYNEVYAQLSTNAYASIADCGQEISLNTGSQTVINGTAQGHPNACGNSIFRGGFDGVNQVNEFFCGGNCSVAASCGYGNLDVVNFDNYVFSGGDDLYYPNIQCSIGASAVAGCGVDGEGGAGAGCRASLNTIRTGGESVGGTFTIFGYSCPMYGVASNSDSNESGGITYVANCNVSSIQIYATAYWPYATTTGSPVWDTASGEQINDPFS